MEWEADEKEVKAAGAELFPDGRRGLRVHGWEIESSNRSILPSLKLQSCSTLASKEPILFYDEVILYEDELADSGVSFLTVKMRVMPSCWFLLLRFWMRVDGAPYEIKGYTLSVHFQ